MAAITDFGQGMKDETTAIHEAAHAVINYRCAGFAGGPISIGKGDGVLGSSSDFVSDSFNADHIEARILSCYAGGHAQREIHPGEGDAGCEIDGGIAAGLLAEWSWEARERDLRDLSLLRTQSGRIAVFQLSFSPGLVGFNALT